MTATKQETKHIKTNLGDIYIRVSGMGTGMIFWPSLLMDGNMWEAQARHFEEHYTVVRVDSPGHGQSSALNRTFTMEECALCLKQIMDALSLDQAVIVGNSWGGMLGGVFAALYPEKALALVLMNCTASCAPLLQKIEFMAMVNVVGLFKQLPNYFIQRGVQAFAGTTTESSRPTVVSKIEKGIAAVNTKSVRWAIKSVVPLRKDHHALIGSVTCPTLVVAGEEDRTFPIKETKKMADAIPNSEFVVLSEVGHLAALENPELTNEIITSFLERSGVS